jgi:penicillin amidase
MAGALGNGGPAGQVKAGGGGGPAGEPALANDVRGTVEIRWNAWGVPFVEAQRDEDLPYAMGLVHAHLRLGQMELVRMAAKGRLSEMGGPIAIDFDVLIRQIGFARASEQSLAMMRPDTRAWVERYVRGVNDYKRSMPTRPLEMRLLAIPDEEWTSADVLTVGRVAGIDINWGAFITYLRNRDEPGFLELWQRLVAYGQGSMPSFGPQTPVPLALMGEVSKSGSNSWVVSGQRRGAAPAGQPGPAPGPALGPAPGAALIANDPHVGFAVPSLWMIAGYRSPSFEALGLQIPGLPVVMLGRNARVAWGGTNMVGLSSAAFDVSRLPPEAFTTRTEQIKVRLWPTVERTVRTTPFGGVITDAGILGIRPPAGQPAQTDAGPNAGAVAIWWRGGEPSDEITAFLDANRAQNWAQFRAAWGPYAVSAQNMLYADVDGNIGQVLAMEFDPAAGRSAPLPLADPQNPLHRWGSPLKSTQLPAGFNPPEGYLVSANNPPTRTDPPVTLLTSANDRVARLSELIEQDTQQSVASHAQHQLDVYSRASHRFAKAVVALADRADGTGQRRTTGARARDLRRAVEALRSWDGRYALDSHGAVIAHRAQYHLAREFYAKRYGPKSRDYLLGSVALATFLSEDVERATAAPGALSAEAPAEPTQAGQAPARIDRAMLERALAKAAGETEPDVTWGQVHRLRVAHWLSAIPLIGSMYRYDEMGVPGNLTTVFKTATNVGPGEQFTRFGANARHISDLSDPDENYFVIMGGQDGVISGVNFIDQVPVWKRGELIRIPFSREGVRREFTTVVTLRPGQVAQTLKLPAPSGDQAPGDSTLRPGAQRSARPEPTDQLPGLLTPGPAQP